MYEWTMSIDGHVIIGRDWDMFIWMMDEIVDWLEISLNQRLIIYVHNLSYEFQWIREWFKWKKVFAIDVRKPIYAITTTGIEFRCSYLLSGYSLSKLGDELVTYKIHKKDGALDYTKIRHSRTKLTPDELEYCINDVQVVVAYIAEQIEQHNGSICDIPYTKTGEVRRYCRNQCFFDENNSKSRSLKRYKYHELMLEMQLDPESYEQVHQAFQGGFTHGNSMYVGKILQNVSSDDFTSSYPATLVCERFPSSSPQKVTLTKPEDFFYNIRYYCCVFECYFTEIVATSLFENYISASKCTSLKGAIINNGRVVSAESLSMVMTEVDFTIISKMYKWKTLGVRNMKKFFKDYLPRDLVKAILMLYKDKTELKGVPEKEIEYMRAKGQLNSVYGCEVTNICRPEISFDTDWKLEEMDVAKQINAYNVDRNRFQFYPWGIYCTAYARRNLFSGILALGDDYVYSDTDSIKSLNREKHSDYFSGYNKHNEDKMILAMHELGLPEELVHPKTIKGKEKFLGNWDFEGTYSRFKTLGAKRYLVEHDGEISLTVSGLNKRTCVPYMLEQASKKGIDVFDYFTDDMYIPPKYTGKSTHTYIDHAMSGIVTDYNGDSMKFVEKSGIHLEEAEYSLSLSQEYMEYLLQIQEEEMI